MKVQKHRKANTQRSIPTGKCVVQYGAALFNAGTMVNAPLHVYTPCFCMYFLCRPFIFSSFNFVELVPDVTILK